MSGGHAPKREKANVKKTDVRNKPIYSKTGPESIEHQVRFEPQRFNSLIFDKGYEVWVDKAMRCPCTVKGTGQALLSCNNCVGTGWIFVNRIETRVAVQNINANIKYENWSQTTTGMAKITSRAVDKLAFMDRVILREVAGIFNEVVRIRDYNSEKVGFAIYEILDMEGIYLFQGDKIALHPMTKDEYEIDGYKIILNDKYNSMKDLSISIRYRHCLTYHLIDMNRDVIKVRTKNCEASDEQLTDMPINGTARKSHYIFDNLKYEEEERLIENSTKREN